MASKSMQNNTQFTICLSIVKTLNLVQVLLLTHLFKTSSTDFIFCAVEVLFSIQDGRHRKLEFNVTLN